MAKASALPEQTFILGSEVTVGGSGLIGDLMTALQTAVQADPNARIIQTIGSIAALEIASKVGSAAPNWRALIGYHTVAAGVGSLNMYVDTFKGQAPLLALAPYRGSALAVDTWDDGSPWTGAANTGFSLMCEADTVVTYSRVSLYSADEMFVLIIKTTVPSWYPIIFGACWDPLETTDQESDSRLYGFLTPGIVAPVTTTHSNLGTTTSTTWLHGSTTSQRPHAICMLPGQASPTALQCLTGAGPAQGSTTDVLRSGDFNYSQPIEYGLLASPFNPVARLRGIKMARNGAQYRIKTGTGYYLFGPSQSAYIDGIAMKAAA